MAVSSAGLTGNSDTPFESSYVGTYDEINATAGTFDLVLHGRFSYWINSAFRGADLKGTPIPSETDGNNLVSIQEGYDAAKTNIVTETEPETENTMPDYGGQMHPAIAAPEDIAPCIFIRLPVPGDDHDVFSMDHPEDDGTIPSEIVEADPLTKPDLWVRHAQNGGTEHQPPKTNSDNFIYARVHNIGCADPGEVTVKFYWALGNEPDNWQPIGEATIHAPSVGRPESTSILWSIGNDLKPDESPYWLIATLTAEDDSPTAGRAVELDNNKTRIRTDVIP